MDELDGGVMELFVNLVSEGFPVWELEMWSSMELVFIFIFSPVLCLLFDGVLVFVAEVYPPVLGCSFQQGGGEDDHEHGVLAVMSSKDLGVGLAVPNETFDVIMGAFKEFRLVHENGFDVGERGESIDGIGT